MKGTNSNDTISVNCTKCGKIIEPYYVCECSMDMVKKLQSENKRLTDRLDRMRKVLEFYADKNNYDITEIEGYSMETTIDADGGDTARQALSQTKQE